MLQRRMRRRRVRRLRLLLLLRLLCPRIADPADNPLQLAVLEPLPIFFALIIPFHCRPRRVSHSASVRPTATYPIFLPAPDQPAQTAQLRLSSSLITSSPASDLQ
jgi:hypothetical protein